MVVREPKEIELVPLAEAVETYLDLVAADAGVPSEAQRDEVAKRIARLVPLYVLSQDGRTYVPLDKRDMGERIPVERAAAPRAALEARLALMRNKYRFAP